LNDRAVKDSASGQGGQKNRHIADLNIETSLSASSPSLPIRSRVIESVTRAEARDAEPLSLEIGDGANLGRTTSRYRGLLRKLATITTSTPCNRADESRLPE